MGPLHESLGYNVRLRSCFPTGVTEKHKKYEVSDSQALLREKRVRLSEDQVRRTDPRQKL